MRIILMFLSVTLLCTLMMPCFTVAATVQSKDSWEATASLATMVGADIKKATGVDWLEYSFKQKLALMTALFDFYKLDKERYSVEKGIESLDVNYYAAHKKAQEQPDFDVDNYFSVPCLLVFGSILGDQETGWGIRRLEKVK